MKRQLLYLLIFLISIVGFGFSLKKSNIKIFKEPLSLITKIYNKNKIERKSISTITLIDPSECNAPEKLINNDFNTLSGSGNTNTISGWIVAGTYATSGPWTSSAGRVNLNSFNSIKHLEFRRDAGTTSSIEQTITGDINDGVIELTNLYWVKTYQTNQENVGFDLYIKYNNITYATISTSKNDNAPNITVNNGATVNITQLPTINTTIAQNNWERSPYSNLRIKLPSNGLALNGTLKIEFVAQSHQSEVRDIGFSRISLKSCNDLQVNNDDYSNLVINKTIGGNTTTSIFSNDTNKGVTINTTNSNISTISWPSGITLNTTTGLISVAVGTPKGVYSLPYKVCDKNYINFCRTAYVTFLIDDDGDGDGIRDGIDLDNDNDGILDIDEECFGFRAQENSGIWLGTTNSNVTVNYISATTQTNVQTFDNKKIKFKINNSGAGKRFVKSSNVNFSFTFSNPVKASEIAFYIEDLDGNIDGGSPTGNYTFRVNGLQPNGVLQPEILNGSNIYNTNFNANYNSITGVYTFQPNTNDQYILLKGYGDTLVSSLTITSTGIGIYDSVAYSLMAYKECDTDFDGIPNYLDLDSDGDGCPDAIEGAGNINSSQLNPNQSISGNVDANGVPILVNGRQGVGIAYDAGKSECLDTDGDGIPNYLDLDNDNDGILDSTEGYNCFGPLDLTALNPSSTSYNWVSNSTTNPHSVLVQTTGVEFRKYPSNGIIGLEPRAGEKITYTFSRPVSNLHLSVLDLDYSEVVNINLYDQFGNRIPNIMTSGFTIDNTHSTGPYPILTQNSTYGLIISASNLGNYASNLNYVDLITNNIKISKAELTFTGLSYTPEYQILGYCLELDSDLDGIPDHLDTDSDGDGCPDAIEGAGDINSSQLKPNQSISGNVDVNGVPILVSGGQGLGNAKDTSKSDCADYDGDGVPDYLDLDKDNDGILDSTEMYCDQTTAPNVSWPVSNLSATTPTLSKQLLFFDFSGVNINSSTGTITKTVVHNGVTYKAEISNFKATHSKLALEGYDILTWNGPIYMVGRYYNVNGSTFKEVLYRRNSTAPTIEFRNENLKYSVKLSATKDGITYPVEAVVFDAETTNTNTAYNQDEYLRFTTSGSPFKLIERTGTSTTTNETGVNTKQIEYRQTQNNQNIGIYSTTGTNVVLDIELGLSNDSDQAAGFAIRLYCDTDNDGIPNYLDTDSDGDGCADALEGSESINRDQIHSINLPVTDPNYPYRGQIKVTYNGTSINTPANIISTSAAGNGVPQLVNNAGNNYHATTNPSNLKGVADATDTTAEVGQTSTSAFNNTVQSDACKFCYKPAETVGVTLNTNVGISTIGKGNDWPENRKGAFLALESKTKGFVLPRTLPSSITNPELGMLIYDTSVNCIKMYTRNNLGVIGWYCMENLSCDVPL